MITVFHLGVRNCHAKCQFEFRVPVRIERGPQYMDSVGPVD